MSLFVAGATLDEVQVSLFVAGAALVDIQLIQVSLVVAGAALGEFLNESRVAKCENFSRNACSEREK